jgi:hypothetical protein
MALVSSALNTLVLIQIVDLDGEQLGAINLFIGNAVLLLALVFKTSQPIPQPVAVTLTDATGNQALTPPKE